MEDRDAGLPRRPVNVNSASLESLRDDVQGIGPVLAARIVAHRQEHGPFASIAELTQIEGIGPTSLERFAWQLTVSEGDIPESAKPPEVEPPIETSQIEARLPEPGAALVADPVMSLTGGEDIAPRYEAEEPARDDLELAEYEEYQDESRQTDDAQPLATGLSEEQPEERPFADVTFLEEQAPMEPQPAVQPTYESPEQPQGAAYAPTTQTAVARPSFWRSFWLVLLGGLAGVVLTLLVILIVSGTLDFASRREVDALSRNMSTMQANNELAWERLDKLTARADAADRKLEQLDALANQVSAIEADLGATQSDLAEAKLALNKTTKDLESLRAQMDEALGALDQRLSQAETGLERLNMTVAELQTTVERLDQRIQRFDAFFGALRDLLIDLEAPAAEPAPAIELPTPTPLPLPTPTPEAKG